MLVLGRVTSLERNHVAVQTATPGTGSVAVKIEGDAEQQRIEVGRHFEPAQGVYSRVRYLPSLPHPPSPRMVVRGV